MVLRIIFIYFFNISFFLSNAQPVIILQSEKTEELGTYTSILKDPTGNLRIQDVIKANNQFNICNEKVFSPNPSKSAYWVRFQVNNSSGNNYFLEIDNPTLDELDIYSIDQNNKVIHLNKSGDILPFSHRDIQRNNFLFSLDLPREVTKTFYLRYTASVITGLPLVLGTSKAMLERSYKVDLLYGFFYGILLISILYNLFLYFSIKDLTFLLYVAYITSFVIFQSGMLGHFFQFVLPEQPWLNQKFIFLFSALTGIFTVSFSQTFLQSKIRTPKLHNSGYFFQAIFAVAIIIMFFDNTISELIISFTGLLVAPYMIVLGITIYHQGYKPARFYIIASGCAILSLCIFILKGQGLIPFTFLTNNIMMFGVGIEAILFSLALGDRYNTYKKDKEEIQLTLNQELQFKITERTRVQEELKKNNERLVKTNKDLDNFVYTASHDLKAPISNLEGLFNLLKDPHLNPKENSHIIEMMDSSLQKLKTTIQELTEISKVQRNQIADIETISFAQIVEEVLSVLKPQIENSHAIIKKEFSESETINFSRKYIRSIIYNLVSNAIKYQRPDTPPQIIIRTQKLDNYTLLSVKDNGLGIPSNQKDKIFDMFKRYHTHVEGTGVGLYLVKRIIDNSGGKIEVESEIGEGSVFKIYFKV